MMYGAEPADSERTAFRRAEKRYKLYKTPNPKKKLTHSPTDLSDVVDFQSILESFERSGDTPPGVYRFQCPGFNRPVFCFADRPGFYFIPSALTVEEQCHWIRETLTTFPQPPNRTSLTAIYGPIVDLFDAAQSQKSLIETQSLGADAEHETSNGENSLHTPKYIFSEATDNAHMGESCKPIAASILLRKLRWSTLGLQFDWSKRNYDASLPHNKIPAALCLLAKRMAVPAMSSGEEFLPEAAIVNYFGPSDMLGGHLDDMEADWSKPIVSISLGCKAIFLLGGKSREDNPIAMFLHSGDIVLMAGQARECFHGVPRIFTDDEHADVATLLSHFSGKDNCCFMDYIRYSRININIRQEIRRAWSRILIRVILWSKPLPASLAGDLHASGIEPSGGHLLHPLHLLHLFSGSLPHQPSSCKLFFGQLQLSSCQLPHSLSISLVYSGKSDLFCTLLLKRLRISHVAPSLFV
ncbi:DNA N(6)-methyladenine demethylase ALKBH1A isoform X2 [Elaeis guineensis]|uniref:DNA N(6)-methyladenine demethylase ALKBH1A isoform X2 n=1 Tax=Elaeis guineensis var. tenera TaxID=51953 RepID=UPI003C6D4A05